MKSAKFLYTFLCFTLFSVTSITLSSNVSALSLDDKCQKIEIIFARGSGDGNPNDKETDTYFDAIEQRLGSALTPHKYALGTDAYNGAQYPHVAIDPKYHFLRLLGAATSAGEANTYGKSVDQGVTELKSYLSQRYVKCQSNKTLYVLGGYSQGAQVMGEALRTLPDYIRNDIVYTGLFGDPKLYYPEGQGGQSSPACRGKDFSPWRRAASRCDLVEGSLGAHKPYLPDDMKQKTGLWCYARDAICDFNLSLETSGHEEYRVPGRAIDQAAREAVEKLQQRLKKDAQQTVSFPFPSTTPPPNYDAIDVKHSFGEGTSGDNVVFMVDISTPMQPYVASIQHFIDQAGPTIVARGGKYTVVPYFGTALASSGNFSLDPLPTAAIYTTPFGTDPSSMYAATFQPPIVGPVSSPPPLVHPTWATTGVRALFSQLQWQPGASKSLLLFTNMSEAKNPQFNGYDLKDVVNTSLRIDPVNIYPIVPGNAAANFNELADGTSGQVVSFDSDIENAANKAYKKTLNRPVPFLKNSGYIAQPGEEITFDASDSYVIDSTITKYEWDFDGDGTFDATTTTPTINHTYQSNFDGMMQVRVRAANDTIANASASVKVAPITPPAPVDSPKNPTYTVDGTVDNKSSVTINWQANPQIEKWLIRINDMPIGYVEGNRTSLQITDIERTNNVTIGIIGAINDRISPSADIVIPSLQSPSNTGTCNYSDSITQTMCLIFLQMNTFTNSLSAYIPNKQ